MAEEQERILLSQKELDRLKVLHEVKDGHLTQAEGALQLKLSERWVREMVRRLRKRGDRAVMHGLRGKRSNRRLAKKESQRAVKIYQAEYADFGPTLAAEYLAEKHKIAVSKETLRKWLIEAGVWKVKPRQVKQVHTWRPRRSCRGELVQWDTSIHDWLEGRSREPVKLIAMIDDASSELFARFVAEDSTVEHMKVLRMYLHGHGRPMAFYTDKAGLFRVNPRRLGYGEEMSREGETQIGRALRELGIELIHAHSPQAKGRVERCFGTLQDRLVKGLRKADVKTLAEGNRYLEKVFLPMWKKRFAQKPSSALDAHRPLGEQQHLNSILSHVESRRVANDYTVSWSGKHYQILKDSIKPGLRSATIRVEQWLDGTIHGRVGETTIPLKACIRQAPAPASSLQPKPTRKNYNQGGKSGWMKNFKLTTGMPVWKAAQPPPAPG